MPSFPRWIGPLVFMASACVSEAPPIEDSGVTRLDGATAADARINADATPAADADEPLPDAGFADALPNPDATPSGDAIPAVDTMIEPDAAPADATLPDATPADVGFDAGGPWVEVATGRMMYTPIGSALLDLNRGPQGGGRFGSYNLWISVHAFGFNPMVSIDITTRDAAGTQVSHVNVNENLSPIGGGIYEFVGISSVLDDCCTAENRDLTIHIDVSDMQGHRASDQRTGHTVMECPRADPNVDVCP